MQILKSKTKKRGLNLIVRQILSGATCLERTLIYQFENEAQLIAFRKINKL